MRPIFHRKRQQGYTLIELMMAGAIGSLIIAATLAVFSLQRALHRNSDRLLSEHFGASVASLAITRDLENAGFHFSSPAMAIRPRDNILGSLPNGDGTVINALSLGDPGAGVIFGTDAIEIIAGNPATVAGQVGGVSGGSGVYTVTLDALDPLSSIDVDAGAHGVLGPMLVFQSATTRCLGKVTGITGLNVTVTTYPAFDGDVTGSGTDVANCPLANMNVYTLMTRKRYLIYQDGTGVFGLYVQNLRDPTNTTRLGVLGPPVLIAEGIEDLQVAYNMSGGVWCNQGTPSDGGTDCDVMTNPAAIQGIKFQLVSRGTDVVKRPGRYRPAVFNHSAGTQDDIDRLALGTSLMLRNLVYVSP
jgi:prepilin-type N-terminal cleavage/methylation domain-containing protein